jgi:hypothetical protein
MYAAYFLQESYLLEHEPLQLPKTVVHLGLEHADAWFDVS